MLLSGEFIYNGKKSIDMYGAYMVYLDNSNKQEIGILKTVQRFSRNGIDDSYRIEKNHLTTQITILFDSLLDETKKNNVLTWLLPNDKFNEFIVVNTNLIYNIIFTKIKCSDYINATVFECDIEFMDAFAYSQVYKFSKLVKSKERLIVENFSNIGEDIYYKPIIRVYFPEDGDVTITNINTMESSKIKGIKGEIVDINNRRELVTSNIKEFKYSDVNGYMRLRYGVNILEIEGYCQVDIFCKYPMMIQ